MKKRKYSLVLGTAAIFVIAGGIYAAGSRSWSPSSDSVAEATSPKIKAVVYKSPTCGCCGNYVAYLKRNGYDVDTVNVDDLSSIKERYHIGSDMESCHTTVIGDHFSEGHIPVEALTQFMENPGSLAGIAMPGMPSGSPGMPGGKTGPFVVHGLMEDGTVSEYLTM